MGKARRVAALILRREFLIPFGGTLAGILGLASAIFTITGRHLELIGALVFGAIVVLGACLLHFRRLTMPQVVVDDVLASDIDHDPHTRVHCPSSFALAAEAKRLAQDCYATSVTIDPDIYEQFRVKNPYILACLTDSLGNFLGYFDIIPLKETFAIPFLDGRVTEAQITHEDVLAPQEMNTCKYLFISGLAARNPNTHAGRKSASMLVWAALKYLDAFYSTTQPLVFALAATKEGDELLQRFRLGLQNVPANRLDKYKLFSIPLSRDRIAARLACLPNWENLCLLSWAPEEPSQTPRRRARRPSLPQVKAWGALSAGPVPMGTR